MNPIQRIATQAHQVARYWIMCWSVKAAVILDEQGDQHLHQHSWEVKMQNKSV